MKKILSVVFIVGLVLSVFGCARVVQKERAVIDGKVVVVRETEYNRIGDQALTGLEAERTEPNGVTLKVSVESQVSEGKLQIEGVISAIGEIVASLMAQGIVPEAEQLAAIQNTLEAVSE